LLVQKIFLSSVMADGKLVPCTAIDLELKVRITRKYEGGKSLSAIARELGL
jgi:transposase-like protein